MVDFGIPFPTVYCRDGSIAMEEVNRINANRIAEEIEYPIDSIDYEIIECYSDGNFEFIYTVDDGKASIITCLEKGEATKLTIPDKIGDYTVTEIKNAALSNCVNLTSITIPDSVTEIGDDAFYGCDNLTISCSPGSYAERYAKQNNIPVEIIF